MNKKLCVVGAGHWGKNHIKTCHDLGVLNGVVDSSKKALDEIKINYPSVDVFLDIESAFKKSFDGFILSTPAATHYKLAKRIILNNYDILIEKPMVLSTAHAKELVELAKSRSTNIMVGHVLLFHPAIRKIKSLIESGEIGDLQYLYSNRLNLGKIRTEEDVFWSLAPHDVAIFQYLIGSSPTFVYAKGSAFIQKDIPDSTLTFLEYENDVRAHIFVSWLHPFKEHRLIVIGSEAMISFEDSLDNKPLKLYSKKYDLVAGLPEKVDGPVKHISYKNQMPLIEELKYFIKYIGSNKMDFSTGEQAINVVQVLEKAGKYLLSND